MKERERKERGEIRMKQKVDKMDERDMEEEGKNRKRKRVLLFLNCYFYVLIRNPKDRRANKAFIYFTFSLSSINFPSNVFH
jgi:hypothetical protein